jgi:hypothetical protein
LGSRTTRSKFTESDSANSGSQPATDHPANCARLAVDHGRRSCHEHQWRSNASDQGASVVNTKGETLGSVDDVVVDLESGKVGYAALSVGGVLGIGDKLFAVPFEEFKITHDTNNNISFVLDVSKERLENAPGFDKAHWPDFASPQWKSQIDNYYHPSSASRPAVDVNGAQNR